MFIFSLGFRVDSGMAYRAFARLLIPLDVLATNLERSPRAILQQR